MNDLNENKLENSITREKEENSNMQHIFKIYKDLTDCAEAECFYEERFDKQREREKKEIEKKEKEAEQKLLKEIMNSEYPTEKINKNNRNVLYRLFELDNNDQLNIKKREEINTFKLLKEIYLNEKKIICF